jgi:tRNA(Ile)-lysidine synthase
MGNTVEGAVAAAVGKLIPCGETLLVACSGGADSVALAAAVARTDGVRGAVGHIDHGLRAESAQEAGKVGALAERLGLPFFLERIEGLCIRGPGLEAAAREARYAALGRLARRAGARFVATAHTRRDQAETLLLRLARGAGPGAMAGIRRKRVLSPGVELVRPLLDVPRAATEELCERLGLSFIDDPHNSDPARARARLRKVWPALLELNPRLEEALAGAAQSLADEDELLAEMAAQAELRADLHPALLRRALLQAALRAGVRPERAHLESLRSLLKKGRGSLDLPGGRAVVSDGVLKFERPAAGRTEPEPAEVAVAGPGRYKWMTRELCVSEGAGTGMMVDLARAPFPWTLRGHRPGDRFRPAGGRSKKVADLWIDAHIPRRQRTSLAVLADAAGRVFWVEGVREGEASRGEKSSPATFEIRSEMDGLDGAFLSVRQSESRSATMDPRLVPQPEGESAVTDGKEPR